MVCSKYKPETVLYEKISEVSSSVKAEKCLIFFHTELFPAYIVLKTLPLNFIVDLTEKVRLLLQLVTV